MLSRFVRTTVRVRKSRLAMRKYICAGSVLVLISLKNEEVIRG